MKNLLRGLLFMTFISIINISQSHANTAIHDIPIEQKHSWYSLDINHDKSIEATNSESLSDFLKKFKK